MWRFCSVNIADELTNYSTLVVLEYPKLTFWYFAYINFRKIDQNSKLVPLIKE